MNCQGQQGSHHRRGSVADSTGQIVSSALLSTRSPQDVIAMLHSALLSAQMSQQARKPEGSGGLMAPVGVQNPSAGHNLLQLVASAMGAGSSSLLPQPRGLPDLQQQLHLLSQQELQKSAWLSGMQPSQLQQLLAMLQSRPQEQPSSAPPLPSPVDSSSVQKSPRDTSGGVPKQEKAPVPIDRMRPPEGCEIMTCRARGMPKDHNFKTAYFVVPQNIKHGDALVCSYSECCVTGPKFVFCGHCRVPVAKRNFLRRHSHKDKAGATDCRKNASCSHTGSSDPQQVSESAASVAYSSSSAGSSSDNENQDFKDCQAKDSDSSSYVTFPENVVAKTSPNQRMKWAELLGSRPPTDSSQDLYDWIIQVLSISDQNPSQRRAGQEILARFVSFPPKEVNLEASEPSNQARPAISHIMTSKGSSASADGVPGTSATTEKHALQSKVEPLAKKLKTSRFRSLPKKAYKFEAACAQECSSASSEASKSDCESRQLSGSDTSDEEASGCNTAYERTLASSSGKLAPKSTVKESDSDFGNRSC